VTTMKVKGTKMRMDLYAGQPLAQSIITDLNTGEVLTLMHGQKLYLKTAGGPMHRTKEASRSAPSTVARPTGKTQKVGDYDTELYTWSNARGISGTAWVAKNFPDYARIRADLAVLDQTSESDNDTTPALGSLPGMVVRSQVAGGGQTITLALISAKETTLDASAFGIPRDYKELPKPKPLTPVVTQSSPAPASGNARVSGATPPSGGSKPAGGSKGTTNSKAGPGNFSTQQVPAW